MDELLNVRTTALVSALISGTLAVCMLYVYNTRKTYPGFRLWTLGYVCLGLGTLLMGFRQYVPDWASIVVANTLIIGQFALLCQGLAIFLNVPRHTWFNLSLSLAVLISFPVFTFVTPGLAERIVIISLVVGLACYRGGYLGLRARSGQAGFSSWLLAGTLFLYGTFMIARSLNTIVHGVSGQNFMLQGWFHGLAVILTGLTGTAMMAALIGMNSQRLEEDLTRAAREAKVLKGFLPICAQCKRIREDDGYWTNLESYLSRHSEAELSEGLCPDCRAELDGVVKRAESPPVLVL